MGRTNRNDSPGLRRGIPTDYAESTLNCYVWFITDISHTCITEMLGHVLHVELHGFLWSGSCFIYMSVHKWQ